MRILIDARAVGPHFPGIGRATLGLLGGLHAVAHADEFVVLYRPQFRDLLHATGIAHDERFVLHPWPDDPLGIAHLVNGPRMARHFRPAVWHAPYYVRPCWGMPPVIVTVYDTIGLAPPTATMTFMERVRPLVWRAVMHTSLRTACHVVTASRSAQRDLQHQYGLAPTKLSVVPLATEPRFAPPSAEDVARVRQTYTLPADYVLYLGSNKPHKNIAALIDAWALLVHDMPTVPPLVVAGRQDARYGEPQKRAADYGLDELVRWIPDVHDDDLPALLGGATLFVFPSLYEGFGFPPLEAMACGVAVICSNRASLPEVVGDAGILVDPEPRPLADAIRRTLYDPSLRATLRARGLERATSFSWQRSAHHMLDLYRKVDC